MVTDGSCPKGRGGVSVPFDGTGEFTGLKTLSHAGRLNYAPFARLQNALPLPDLDVLFAVTKECRFVFCGTVSVGC